MDTILLPSGSLSGNPSRTAGQSIGFSTRLSFEPKAIMRVIGKQVAQIHWRQSILSRESRGRASLVTRPIGSVPRTGRS